MSGRILQFDLGLDEPDDSEALLRKAAKKLRVPPAELGRLRVLKRSVDARRGRVVMHYTVALGEPQPPLAELGLPHPRETNGPRRVVIVGDGPAGLFAAYGLAREGLASIVIDRGKKVQPRRRDLKQINARGTVNPQSNYCFGEGGAGTYSDGKLYTRSHKRGPVRDVIEILALHGAPLRILEDARPHIGSNLLPKIIEALRTRLEACGVQFRFGQQMVDLQTEESGSDRRIAAVTLRDVETGRTEDLEAEAVVLAVGHSARDVFDLARRVGLTLEPKAFALGVRVEHPQPLIDRIQYGRYAGHHRLGAASYRLTQQVEERGVFSFCMCPGGWIVPAMTDSDHLVVNGMSLSKRNSPFANSGLVVGVTPEDFAKAGLEGPLAGVALQRRAERAACESGGSGNRAPATRVADFLAGHGSSTLPTSSYLPGLAAEDVSAVLDQTGLPLARHLRQALVGFSSKMRGFDSSEGILVGVESRTSSPVRLLRDTESLQSLDLQGLYPSGEGAGYAGGIVSAAVDGLRVAEKVTVLLRGRHTASREPA